MTAYFKAVRPDGGSFRDPSFTWATEPGGITSHPTGTSHASDDAAHYLSVSTVATDCTGMHWPCRLLEVEPIGPTWAPDPSALPNKRAGLSFRTVRELPATDALGPQGVQLAALIERAGHLTYDEARRLAAARDAARHAAWAAAWAAAWDAARHAAMEAARDAARHAAWDAARHAAWAAAMEAAWDAARHAAWAAAWAAARDAARALTVRDLISDEHYQGLAGPWLSVIGVAS